MALSVDLERIEDLARKYVGPIFRTLGEKAELADGCLALIARVRDLEEQVRIARLYLINGLHQARPNVFDVSPAVDSRMVRPALEALGGDHGHK